MPVAEWIAIGRVDEVPPGHAARVDIDDHPIALFNIDNEFFCLDDTCSHAQASLSEGDLDATRCAIECPLHGSAFDLRTGEPVTLPAVQAVAAHALRIEDGVVSVALQQA